MDELRKLEAKVASILDRTYLPSSWTGVFVVDLTKKLGYDDVDPFVIAGRVLAYLHLHFDTFMEDHQTRTSIILGDVDATYRALRLALDRLPYPFDTLADIQQAYDRDQVTFTQALDRMLPIFYRWQLLYQ